MATIIECKTVIHYFRYEGVVSVDELRKAIHDAHVNHPANRLLHDVRKADISHFNNGELKGLGMYLDQLVSNAERGKYRSAIVVADKLTYGLIRCAISHGEIIAEQSTRVYYDVDFAIDWLVGLRE